jgi:predicted ferric reductase
MARARDDRAVAPTAECGRRIAATAERVMGVARADGRTAGEQRSALYLVDADGPQVRAEPAGSARYRQESGEAAGQRPSWLVSPGRGGSFGRGGPRGAPAAASRFVPAPFRPAAPDPQEAASFRPAGPGQQAASFRPAGPDPQQEQRRAASVEIVPPEDRPPAEAVAGNRLLTVLLFFSGLATCLAIWVFDTRAGSIGDTASLLTAVGRITGLVAGYLLFIQLLMMSRVSWLEEWVGARDLLRWHRWLGTSLVAAVGAHIVFIVFGYAAAAGTSPVTQGWTIITTLPEMLSATVATGILVAVSLLAVRQIRRRLPYELWHLLHLSAYLVLLLGYGHQVATGADLSGRFASIFWPSLAALVVAALVWGRIVEPLVLNLRHRLEVLDVVTETDDTVSVYIGGRQLDRLPARAGQFLRWRFLDHDGWWQSHPFSLSAAPNSEWLRLTVTAAGNHTSALAEVEPGTKVWAEGPFGTFTAERRTRRRALLIAGGSGIAPIRALLEDMPADTVVVYRAHDAQHLVFRDELDVLARRRGGRVHYVLGSREAPGPRRLLSPDGMAALVPDVNRRDVYLCGPPGLVAAAVQTLTELDVPSDQVHLDPFEF